MGQIGIRLFHQLPVLPLVMFQDFNVAQFLPDCSPDIVTDVNSVKYAPEILPALARAIEHRNTR